MFFSTRTVFSFWRSICPSRASYIGNGRTFIQAGLWGGYPAAPLYRHNVRDTNFFELVEKREPYPVHEPDPAQSELVRVVEGERQFDIETVTLPQVMRHGDLYL